MYSAGVPVPQGYHITVADSFSQVKFEGVPNHCDSGTLVFDVDDVSVQLPGEIKYGVFV